MLIGPDFSGGKTEFFVLKGDAALRSSSCFGNITVILPSPDRKNPPVNPNNHLPQCGDPADEAQPDRAKLAILPWERAPHAATPDGRAGGARGGSRCRR